MKPIIKFWLVNLFLIVLLVFLNQVLWAGEELSFAGQTIQVLTHKNPAVDSIVAHISQFERETGIKVVYEQLPPPQIMVKASLAFGSPKPIYDVISQNQFLVPKLVEAGWVTPLEEFIKDPKLTDPEKFDLNDFLKSYLDALSWKGKLYALPIWGSTNILVYNKEMFREAGIGRPPETIDELVLFAKKMTRGGKYGIALRGTRDQGLNILPWTHFFRAYGGEFFDTQGRPILNTSIAIKATEIFAELHQKYNPPGSVNFFWKEVLVAFEQGIVGMFIDAHNLGEWAQDPKESKVVGKIGYALVPSGPAGRAFDASATGYFVAKTSERKGAAWVFNRWASSKELQLKRALSDATRYSVFNDPEMRKKGYDKMIDVILYSLERGSADYRPRSPDWSEIANRLGIALSEVIAGQKSAKEALDKANEDIYKMRLAAGYYK